jgi:GR25 family glycosyltransferase involved in LPS biosynthesis
MFADLLHFQITTQNEIGLARRSRNINKWLKFGLEPTYISTNNEFVSLTFLDSSLNRKLRGISGCLDTHKEAWRKFLKKEERFLLITEDDSVPLTGLDTELKTFLGQFVNRQAHEPMLIQLGVSEPAPLTPKRIVVALKHILQFRGKLSKKYVRNLSFGTHGYLVNKSMAEFLLTTISGSLIPIDDQFRHASRNPSFHLVYFQRRMISLIDQDALDSSIEISVRKNSINFKNKSKLVEILTALADSDCDRLELLDNYEGCKQ